jgi:putative SOS response-associated peptidase YedK
VCNLYSLTKGQDAIRQIAKAMRDTAGNLPPFPGIFPDTATPVVHTAKDRLRDLTDAVEMPSPAFALKGRSKQPPNLT